MVENSVTMEDGLVPVFAGHLLLYEVGADHLDEIDPGVFNKNVGVLSFGGGCNDIRLVVSYPSEALAPDEFLIEVGIELAGKSVYASVESRGGVGDIVLYGILQAIKPVVSGGNVN